MRTVSQKVEIVKDWRKIAIRGTYRGRRMARDSAVIVEKKTRRL